MDIEQILAPYRGKNVALQIDTQEDWDAIIPHLRKKSEFKFTKNEFTTYSPIHFFLKEKGEETFGSVVYAEESTIIKFSDLKTNVYECW